jgi:hypothetical protein
MCLVKCPDCGTEVSDLAAACAASSKRLGCPLSHGCYTCKEIRI